MSKSSPLLFSVQAYDYLAEEIAELTGFPGGELEVKTFPDGERYQRILTGVHDRDVILIGGTLSDGITLQLYDLACALVKNGAISLTLIIPYFGYSTMERAIKPGEVVTAKSRARLFSSIPQACNGNRLILLDLHSEGIPHYFEGQLITLHLYAKPVIMDTCRNIGGDDFILACTDAGRAKWVESLANDLGVEGAFVFKRRLSGSETEIVAMNADVKGKHVIIYDDMIRTGGSLINAAKAYLDAGAEKISAIATHGVLPGGSPEKLKASGLFEQVIVTNSHARSQELSSDFFQIESIAPLIASYLEQHFQPGES